MLVSCPTTLMKVFIRSRSFLMQLLSTSTKKRPQFKTLKNEAVKDTRRQNCSMPMLWLLWENFFVSFIKDKHRFQHDSSIPVLENWKYGSYKNWYRSNSLIHNSQKGNALNLLSKERTKTLIVHTTVLLSHNNMLQGRKN